MEFVGLLLLAFIMYWLGYLTASMMFIKKQDDKNYEKEYKERIDKRCLITKKGFNIQTY